MSNLEKIRQLYAAFERWDMPAILEHMAEEIEWEYAVPSVDVPWLRPRHNRAEVPAFFASMGAFELHRFQPKTFLESGDVVVVLIDVDLTVKATGERIIEVDEVHIWRFDAEGRIAGFTHKVDTHRHWMAFRGAVHQEA